MTVVWGKIFHFLLGFSVLSHKTEDMKPNCHFDFKHPILYLENTVHFSFPSSLSLKPSFAIAYYGFIILHCNQEPHRCKHLHNFHCADSAFLVSFGTEICYKAPQFVADLKVWSTSVPRLILQSHFVLRKSGTYTSVAWTDTVSLLPHCVGHSKSKASLDSGGGQIASTPW